MSVQIVAEFLLAISASLALAFLLNWCWRGPSWVKSAIKTGSVAGLAGVAALLGLPGWLVLALVLGAAGDYFLSRPGERAFLAGLVSFALAHLAYVALMAGLARLADLPWALAGGLVLFGIGMALLLWPRTGAMRAPVMIYVVIICLMGALALAQPEAHRGWTLAAGLFILSDAVLSLELFVLRDGHPARRVTPLVIWATYWLAQAGFLWTAMGAVATQAL